MTPAIPPEFTEPSYLDIPLTLTRAEANAETMEIPCSFASDAILDDPWLGKVQLSMDPTAVDLDEAIARGIPVMEMHERDLPVGRVRDVRLEANRLLGTIRFSRSDKGKKLYLDCVDGILTDTSVGASISAVRETDNHLIALRWKPNEVSLVDRGADSAVGINRRHPHPVLPTAALPAAPSPQEDHPMADQPKSAEAQVSAAATPPATGISRAAEQDQAIMGLAEYINKRHPETEIMRLAEDFSQFGRGFDEFRAEAWGIVKRAQELAPKQAAPQPDLGLNQKETRQFSIVRAALAQLTGDWQKAGFELECSRAIADQLGKAPRGFFVPAEVQRQMGAVSLQRQSVGDPTAGGFIVAQDYRGDLFVEALRAQSVAMQAGVRTLPGLQGNVTIPVQTGSATFSWIQEGANGTDSNLTFGAINLAPRTISGAVPMTRRLLAQSSPAIEQLVRMDLVKGAALALDLAIFEGAGHSGVPLGVANNASINTTAISTDASPTWAEMVSFEQEVATDNALGGSMAYVTTPAIVGHCKTTSKDTGSGLFIQIGNEINGYPVYTTTQLTTSLIIFGDWSQVLVGMWGVLDIKADESTLAASGGLVLRAFQDADVGIRHPVAFCKGT